MSSITAHRLFAIRPSMRTLVDAAIASTTFAGSLLLLSHGSFPDSGMGPGLRPSHAGSENLDVIRVGLTACSTAPLLVWRRSPFGVFVVTTTVSVLLVGLTQSLAPLLGPAAALYLFAASRGRRGPGTWRTLGAVTGLLVTYLGVATAVRGMSPGIEFLPTLAVWAVAWFAGERTRLRREQVAALRERAVRAEREAERERLLAAAEERTRIARDLHDSAGHAISVIAVRAGAARLGHDRDPERSRVALEAIEELARKTVEEIDHMVATLREDDATTPIVEAPLGLASLDTLIARHVAAGLDVTLVSSGSPRALAGAADQAAYRILQEALTNATRHGTGGARIELAFRDTALDLTVTNPVPAKDVPRSSGGHGLIGMRERMALVGGHLDAERVNGTFRVRARIPYGGHGR